MDDEATQQLMNAFYQALQVQKFSKAKTLRQAQLTLIEQAFVSGKAHRYYWSLFILTVNGFVSADVGFFKIVENKLGGTFCPPTSSFRPLFLQVAVAKGKNKYYHWSRNHN